MSYEETRQFKVFACHADTTTPKESGLLRLYHWLSYPRGNPQVRFESFRSQGYTVCPHCGQTLSKSVLNLMFLDKPFESWHCPFCEHPLTPKKQETQQKLAIVTATSANAKCVTFHSEPKPCSAWLNSHAASPVSAFSSVTHFTVADEGGSYA